VGPGPVKSAIVWRRTRQGNEKEDRVVNAARGFAAMIASTGGVIGGLIGFILWVVILVWIYNLAKRKGRHALLWTILGVFFTLITLIVLLVLPSKRTTEGYGR
jgi:hypothetical protein